MLIPPLRAGRPARPTRFPSLLIAGLLLASPPVAGVLGAQGGSGGAAPQTAGTPALTLDQLRLLAEAQVAIGAVHDSADARSAQARNKTVQAQTELAREKQRLLGEVLKQKGLTEAEYRRQRFLVSTTDVLRAPFDSVYAKLTGAPLPGRVTVATVTGFVPSSQLPSGMVGTHISHLTTSFIDTPDKTGLLVIGFAEATVASQHAALAMRNTADLAAMQLHAGHILNALDPSLEKTGPGKGFGVKAAALGVANHIELAAKEANASPNVKVHATHIATAARAAAARADQAIALAQQLKQAKDAKAAAALLAQLTPLCQQLTLGADINADGRIDWADKEGGLQQANEHLQLLLAGERR